MINLPSDGRRWERKNSNTWRNPRLVQRSRRPIFLLIACVVCLVFWHHSRSASLSPNRHRFEDGTGNIALTQDRRSIDEQFGLPVKRIQKDEFESNHAPSSDHNSQERNSDEAFEKTSSPKPIQPIHVQDETHDRQQNEAKPAPRIKPAQDLPSGPEVLLIPGDPADYSRDEPQFADSAGEHLPKGPVEVQANLNPDTEKAPLISSPDQPAKERIIEAEPLDHLTLEEKGDSLPEIIHIPFEDAVKDDVLHGWEDSWVSEASYDHRKWGQLEEIKIDFVYLCKLGAMIHGEA